MSLEQTIADLVAASNNLTGTINSKMSEIEQEVDNAVKAIPNLARSYYIDGINGNDANDGSEASPLESIREAMMRSGDIPFVNIRLSSGQSHEYRGKTDDSYVYHTVRNSISFKPWGNAGAEPIIEPVVTTKSDGTESLMHFMAIEDSGSVNGQNVVLKLPQALDDYGNPAAVLGVGGAFIGRAHGRPVGSGRFSWSDGDIILSEHFGLLASTIAGNYFLALEYLNVDDPSGTGASRFIDLASHLTLDFAVNGVTLAASMGGFGSCIKGKVLAADGQPINVSSVVDLSV